MLSNFVGASTEKRAMKPRILPSGGELLNNIGAVPAVLFSTIPATPIGKEAH